MISSDFDITEENGIFVVSYEDRKILCSDTDDVVKDASWSLIHFIVDDLDRCGEVSLTNENRLDCNKAYCAYLVFSAQKLLIENSEDPEVLTTALQTNPLYDQCLIQIANGPPLETEQISRLNPIRKALADYLGKIDFDKLTEFAWGRYYYDNYSDHAIDSKNVVESWEGPGLLIEPDEYKHEQSSQKLYELFQSLTLEQQGAALSLFYAIGQKSLILPIGLLLGWINQSGFVNAVMGLGSNILNQPGVEEEGGQLHQDAFRTFDEVSNVALAYSKAKKPDEDIQDQIRGGESKTLEFKETLSWDVRTKRKEKWIEESVLKTMAAFMNSEGGQLFIGVDDKGTIVGVEQEVTKLYKTNDKFLLHLKDLYKAKIGGQFYPLINVELIEVENKEVARISCAKSDKEVFIGDEFFVRTTPATDKLEGTQMLEYVRRRFG